MEEDKLDKLLESEKFTVGDEIDPSDWVCEKAEGRENVRPFMLGWNAALDQAYDIIMEKTDE